MNDKLTMTSTSATSGYSTALESTAPAPVHPYENTVATEIRAVYMWVLLAVGLPCNAACVVTILSMRVTTATFYVALLAVADSLALIVKAIYHQTEVSSAPSCYMMYINNFFSCYANWVLVLIVFQRYFVVRFPLRVRLAFTVRRMYISAAVLALALFCIIPLPTFFLRTFTETASDNFTCKWREEFDYGGEVIWDHWVIGFFYSYLPFLVIVVFTALITRELQRQRRKRRCISTTGIDTGVDGSTERVVSIMLACAGFIFLLLTLPACLFHLYISDLYDKTVVRELSEWYLIYQVVTLLSDANHAVNFFIYFLSGQEFRSQFLQLLQRCTQRSSRTKDGAKASSAALSREDALLETRPDKCTVKPNTPPTEMEHLE